MTVKPFYETSNEIDVLRARIAELSRIREGFATHLGSSLYEATKNNENLRWGRESLYDGIAACDDERARLNERIDALLKEREAAHEDAAEAPEPVDAPELTEAPELAEVPEAEDAAELADVPMLAEEPELADVPEVLDVPSMADVSEYEDLAELPETADVPELADFPEVGGPQIEDAQEASGDETPVDSVEEPFGEKGFEFSFDFAPRAAAISEPGPEPQPESADVPDPPKASEPASRSNNDFSEFPPPSAFPTMADGVADESEEYGEGPEFAVTQVYNPGLVEEVSPGTFYVTRTEMEPKPTAEPEPKAEPSWRPSARRAEEEPNPQVDASSSSCPRCGAPVQPGNKFCMTCGAPLTGIEKPQPKPEPQRAPVCPECGAPVDPSFKFCMTCGHRL